MDLWVTLGIAVGLAMDAVAVSLGVGGGGKRTDTRSRLRLSFHFGLFQGLMTLLGWAGGSLVADRIRQVDHWIAFGLLTLVGTNMVRSYFQGEGSAQAGDPTRGGIMVMLSIATSIDALVVGMSLAFIATPIGQAAGIIFGVTFALCLAANFLGSRLGAVLGRRMEMLGGLLLVGIGLRILFSHLA